jgi:hypothetical protein
MNERKREEFRLAYPNTKMDDYDRMVEEERRYRIDQTASPSIDLTHESVQDEVLRQAKHASELGNLSMSEVIANFTTAGAWAIAVAREHTEKEAAR